MDIFKPCIPSSAIDMEIISCIYVFYEKSSHMMFDIIWGCCTPTFVIIIIFRMFDVCFTFFVEIYKNQSIYFTHINKNFVPCGTE